MHRQMCGLQILGWDDQPEGSFVRVGGEEGRGDSQTEGD